MPDAEALTKAWVINSELGRNGRFANQVFQYMFLSCHARQNNLSFANPPWIGDEMFCIQRGTDSLPAVSRRLVQNTSEPGRCPISNARQPLGDTDVSGYFQYPGRHYAEFKAHIRKDFAFRGAYAKAAQAITEWFDAHEGPVAVVHIRRRDYGYGYFFRAPVRWYRDWLDTLENLYGNVIVYVATDEPDTVLPEFAGYHTLSQKDLPFDVPGPCYVADFIALTRGEKLAISNSSFSFAASMFNTRQNECVRPTLSAMKLVPYDPWQDSVLLTDRTAEEFGGEFVKPHSPFWKRWTRRTENAIK